MTSRTDSVDEEELPAEVKEFQKGLADLHGTLPKLTEEEAYLATILMDHSGIDQAEFLWYEPTNPDGCFRARPYQWAWWRNDDTFQVDLSARTVGKSLSVSLRGFAHIFVNPGHEMVVTAPEKIHLDPVMDLIEQRLVSTRLSREMLPKGRGAMKHQPFMCVAMNKARIIGRIPQRDGKGMKGVHPLWLEVDECFSGSSLITTKRGLVPIKDVVVGDWVLTHRRRWRQVTATAVRRRPSVTLRGQGHPDGLIASVNHPFWAAQVETGVYLKEGDRINANRAEFVKPEVWVSAANMEGQYWCSPTSYPQAKVPAIRNKGSRRPIPWDDNSVDFWWLVGLWVAEGCENHAQISFSIHVKEVEEVVRRLMAFSVSVSVYDLAASDSAKNVVVYEPHLAEWLVKHFGKGARNKSLPMWLMGIDKDKRRAFLSGLIYGDGFEDPDLRYAAGRWKLSTASRKLAISVRMLALTLGYSISCYYTEPRDTQIRGRPVHSNGWYQVVGNAVGQGYEFKRCRYSKVRSVEEGAFEDLYDLTVDEDHSFMVDGFLCSNSQDFPDKGYAEVIETLKVGVQGAVWRCVAEGQLVLTRAGWKPIESVQVGDEVLTHRNRWRKVLRSFDNGMQDCVVVRGQGHPGLVVTPSHKVYAADSIRSRAGATRDRKQLRAPSWLPVREFAKTAPYTNWASPTGKYISTPVPPMARGYREDASSVVGDVIASEWLWLYGLYVAEGYCCDFLYTSKAGQTHRHRRAHWCVSDEEAGLVVDHLNALGLKSHRAVKGRSVKVVVTSAACVRWLEEHAGRMAGGKRLADWVFALPTAARRHVFDGLTFGDGAWSEGRLRWEHFSKSHELILDLKLLGQSLGYIANVRKVEAVLGEIEGRGVFSQGGWTVQLTEYSDFRRPQSTIEPSHVWSPVGSVDERAGARHVWDLEVEEDHSYVVEGIVVSNCHGVTNGVGGWFYDITQGGINTAPLRDTAKKTPEDWTVHRMVAMVREDWTDEERTQKIQKYGGSREAPDYLRNVLGLHGPASNVIFVLQRLMKCADDNLSSNYNQEEYFKAEIRDGDLLREGADVLNFLDFPSGLLRKYKTFWVGMDVGYVNDPSEVLVFAEYTPSSSELNVKDDQGEHKARPQDGMSRLKLVARISLHRVKEPDQVEVILHVIDFFKPQVFAMDKTGNGLPLYQNVMERLREAHDEKRNRRSQQAMDCIKGYGFSEKILVDFDDSIHIPDGTTIDDQVKEAGIYRMVLEVSTDVLRTYVDAERLWLPWDKDLLSQFSGQTFTYSRNTRDAYGRRRIFSQGDFHCLDAARMAALGHKQFAIEALVGAKDPETGPVLDLAITQDMLY